MCISLNRQSFNVREVSYEP
ncbi:hypothetical protein F383_35956 [Gossypium arboreum]|uniref:Uncharacterized protein n=1 Tax=Gossypium arboreum TaxID=29729 RepID=A0A0B0PTD2_GOSAR|nr:hypothetical protein F383_35956 [Gossypium arboreum]